MKCFYLIGILFLGVLSCRATAEEDLQDITKSSEDDGFYTKVKELFEKKCKQAGGEDAYKNLTRVIDGAKFCLAYNLPTTTKQLKEFKDSGEGSSEDICTDKRKKVRLCFDDFVGAWEGCSEPTEKYLPHFVFDAVEAVLDHICAEKSGFIEKVSNSLECVDTLKGNEDFTGVCNDELKFLKDDTPEEITLTKEELCQDIETAKTCFGAYIDKHCPGSDFKALVGGVYTAAHSACDKRHRRSLPLSFRLY